MESLNMYSGETRVVTVEITSCDEEPFTIRNPSYRLIYSDEVEESGTPVMEDHDLTITLSPNRIGKYILEVTVNVASETIIRKLPIYVRE